MCTDGRTKREELSILVLLNTRWLTDVSKYNNINKRSEAKTHYNCLGSEVLTAVVM
jgi:hypothetical protein